MKKYLRAALLALSFLTVLPLPVGKVEEEDLARATGGFPLAGCLLGVLSAGVAYFFLLGMAAGRVPLTLAAVVIVAAGAWGTGALHLDGLADIFDGLGVSRDNPKRAMEVMRDSRLGTFGTVALFIFLAAKIIAVHTVLLFPDSAIACITLLLAPIAARWAVVPVIAWFPSLRKDGLGQSFAQHCQTKQVVLASLLLFVGLFLAGSGRTFLFGAVATLGVALWCAVWLTRRFGGLTGDSYGMVIEFGELAFLLTVLSRESATAISP